MLYYTNEYRINKKGAECYKTDSFEQMKEKLSAMRENKPRVIYTAQSRYCRLDRFGVKLKDCFGRPQWSPWEEVKI